jgi:CRP-like cAMP-binding protein
MVVRAQFTVQYRNRLLAALVEDDAAWIGARLEPVELPLGTVIVEPDSRIGHAYFIDEGLCSVVSRQIGGGRIEIGLFGREGFSGTSLLLGADRIPHEVFLQVAGRGHRIAADALLAAIDHSPRLRDLLLRYIQTFLIQTAQTALANAGAPAEERLARWLLMYHDRQDGDDLSVTHDFLSMMLGVRRPTVTVAIHTLEGAGLIRARRGRITVLDRIGLEEAAGESYGPAEAEYERLIGPLRRRMAAPGSEL